MPAAKAALVPEDAEQTWAPALKSVPYPVVWAVATRGAVEKETRGSTMDFNPKSEMG